MDVILLGICGCRDACGFQRLRLEVVLQWGSRDVCESVGDGTGNQGIRWMCVWTLEPRDQGCSWDAPGFKILTYPQEKRILHKRKSHCFWRGTVVFTSANDHGVDAVD